MVDPKFGRVMLYLNGLVHTLEKLLNPGLFSDFCPNGLQIEGKNSIKKIGVAVSADLATLEKASELNVDALIVHHGLFWNQDPYPIVGNKRKKIEILLNRQISLLAYHLPLDAHQQVGNNWKVAIDLQWENLEPFGKYGSGPKIGVKGNFNACSIEEFVLKLEQYYGNKATCALGGKKRIQTAALISGGSYKSLKEAIQEGVDCFITGNFDEPAWSMAYEENIHFIAMGHTTTEKIGPKALGDYLCKEFGVECLYIDTLNPF